MSRFDNNYSIYWLLAPIATAIIGAAYILTHSTPSWTTGLFLLMGETIKKTGFALPTSIPQSVPPIPFTYPPIGPYIYAVLQSLGLGLFGMTLVAPAVVMIIYSVAAMFLGSKLFEDDFRAAVFAVAIGTSPTIMTMHISGGGLLRSTGFLWLLLGLGIGLQIFRDNDYRTTLIAVLLFALSLATHLYTAMFFGVSYLAFYFITDRSQRGLLSGATVFFGGLILTSPWWLTVISRHGFGVYVNASSSATGIGPDLGTISSLLFISPPATELATIWTVFGIIGVITTVLQREWLLPGWFAAAAVLFPTFRFQHLITIALGVWALFNVLLPVIKQISDYEFDEAIQVGVVCLILVYSTGAGALYAADYPGSIGDFADSRLWVELDEEDIAALEWVKKNTNEDATLLVRTPVSEWAPYLSDRKLVIPTRGIEFLSSDTREQNSRLFEKLNKCESPRCVEEVAKAAPQNPDYIYFSKPSEAFKHRLVESNRFEVVYNRDGVLILRWSNS
jgi:hypothetical protein